MLPSTQLPSVDEPLPSETQQPAIDEPLLPPALLPSADEEQPSDFIVDEDSLFEQTLSSFLKDIGYDGMEETKISDEKKSKVAKVKIRNVVYRNKKLQIRWKKVSQASGYEVSCSVKKGKKTSAKKADAKKKNTQTTGTKKKSTKNTGTKKSSTKRTSVRKTSVRLNWKKPGTCCIKVRAFQICNGKKIYGKWSKIRRIKVTGQKSKIR